MPTNFTQTATAAGRRDAECSGNTNNSTEQASCVARVGGSVATSDSTVVIDSSAVDLNAIWVELDELGSYNDDDTTGDWTWRLRTTVGNHLLTLDEVHICHVGEFYAAKTTVGGTTGINSSLATAGTFSGTIPQGGALSSYVAGEDKIIVIFAFDNSQAMTQTLTFRFDVDITAPGSWTSTFPGSDDEEWARPWLVGQDPDVTVYA